MVKWGSAALVFRPKVAGLESIVWEGGGAAREGSGQY